ncbi:MAG: ArsA family ATPase [Myxococcota bacterium]|nr:ArsA family ATPase [Myxococcota bacterium]
MRVLLHTGKGGVGKTTHAAATALAAARAGHRVFLLSSDPAHSLGDSFGLPIGSRPTELAPGVVAQEVAVLEELERSWSEIQGWLRGLLRDETDDILADELLVFPGLEELVSLRAIREVEAMGEFDVCVVDCAPTGATLRMLRFPDALRIFMESFFDLKRQGARVLRPILDRFREGLVPSEDLFEAFERLYSDIDQVQRILRDTTRTTARLVVNPSRLVVAETRRSYAYLCLYGVATDAVIVNRVLPEEARRGYFARWARREQEEMAEIEASFPVPRLQAPLLPREVRGLEALESLAESLWAGRDPAERLTTEEPIVIEKQRGRVRIRLALPGARKEELDLKVRGTELFLRVRDASRCLALPDSVSGRALESARLEDGVLWIEFA